MNILEIKNAKKIYGADKNVIRALDGVDMEVNEGEFVSIIGSSGSGKTTLLNIIGGLDSPTEGDVFIKENDLTKMNAEELTVFRRRNIGFVFQNYNLIPVLNVYENITLPLMLDKKTVDKIFVNEIVTDLGLENKMYDMPNNLSGGQQQRTAIARALAIRPAIILADEPTGNLDTKTSNSVIQMMRRMAQNLQQTMIIVTHDEGIAAQADRIIRIEDGKICV